MADVTGERGPKGDHGQSGHQGDRGAEGQIGSQGDRGDEGRRGWTGERGDTGVPGERGPTGDHGQHGDHGTKGEKGEQGEKGKTGYRSTFGYIVLMLAIGLLFVGQYRQNRDLEKTSDRANQALCASTTRSTQRQIKLLEERIIDYRVLAKYSPSKEIRAHYTSRLPQLRGSIMSGRAQLKKLGDCASLGTP